MGLYDSCWLPRYEAEPEPVDDIKGSFTVLGSTLIMNTIKEELTNQHSFFSENRKLLENKKVILSRTIDLPSSMSDIQKIVAEEVNEEGYVIKEEMGTLFIIGKEDKGVLYGMFHLFRLIQREISVEGIHLIENPNNPVRMINHWDNMDDNDFMGSVERGYAGRSIFYENNKIVEDKSRIIEYARLLASIGINSISINNVNVHQLESNLITKEFLPEVAKIADIFRKYGIKLFLSINYASPIELGDLPNADPLEQQVKDWWKAKVTEIYDYIPDFGGFVVKADSEGRPGPFTYNRNHADGANLLGEALKPFGGILFWRCFVYNCLQDWRDRSTDRAKAAYDHFKPLDGTFLDNVILQVKSGPMDFQVREPVSPLFGAMEQTNQVMEFQITQEYTGQQKHICFLVPQWKEVLDFETYAKEGTASVGEIVNGSLYDRPYGGIVAVSNVGCDYNWTGHKLAQANLYGYGRLIWDTDIETEDIVTEWVELTFGKEQSVVENIKYLLMNSWLTYEKYTAPLGVGWMVEPGHHYGPNVDGYEYSRWGTYHFADCHGIGVDRTMTSGTGYVGQYFLSNQERYENIETCPDELLLFFHHVPYTHVLQSGKTVIQHIYDTHFEGIQDVENFIEKWQELAGKIDDASFQNVCIRLEEQLRSAKEWRDQINTYFYRKSGVADMKGRTIY